MLICAVHLEKSLGPGSLQQVLGFVIVMVSFSRPPPMVLLLGTVPLRFGSDSDCVYG